MKMKGSGRDLTGWGGLAPAGLKARSVTRFSRYEWKYEFFFGGFSTNWRYELEVRATRPKTLHHGGRGRRGFRR